MPQSAGSVAIQRLLYNTLVSGRVPKAAREIVVLWTEEQQRSELEHVWVPPARKIAAFSRVIHSPRWLRSKT